VGQKMRDYRVSASDSVTVECDDCATRPRYRLRPPHVEDKDPLGDVCRQLGANVTDRL